MPESLGQLGNLETLDLHNNKLVLLPASLRDLARLRFFDISDNRFSDLALDSLANIPSLVEIYASKNALTGSLFPSTVASLPNLEVLEVANNSIASLSFSSSLSLPSLRHLDVSRNRLYAFPDLSSWADLTTLLAEDNGLTDWPAGFTTLHHLKSADFTNNDIRVVDAEIARMAGLESLRLAGNPLREKRWVSMSTEEVKRQLGRRLEEMEGVETF